MINQLEMILIKKLRKTKPKLFILSIYLPKKKGYNVQNFLFLQYAFNL